jgi:hypothetical protein
LHRSARFIIHVLDDRHLLVQPHMVDAIKARRDALESQRTACPNRRFSSASLTRRAPCRLR